MSQGVLDGKVAIVTGGGQGLGRAEAIELARCGATVIVNDIGLGADGVGLAETVAAEIGRNGCRAVADTHDVADSDGAAAIVSRAVDEFGSLDIVVNNAGIVRDRMLFNMSDEDWDAVIRVHLRHTFLLTRAACRLWRERAKAGSPVAGRIINTTSGSGLTGAVGQANYAAAKAGIAGFTLGVAQEMHRYGVTVNAISPVARTQMTDGVTLAEADPDYDRYAPMHLAPFVVWLASEDASWITGQVFRLTGGFIGRFVPWTVVDAEERPKPFAVEDYPLVMRRMYGTYPVGHQGAKETS